MRQTEQLQQLYGNRPSDGSSAGDDLANLLGVTNAPAPVSVNKTKGKGGGSDPIHGQMVNILQAQRDRYKERLTVVETSMLKLQQQFEAMQLAKSQLEADNVALYGKIRYLQSYGGEQKSYISPKVQNCLLFLSH